MECGEAVAMPELSQNLKAVLQEVGEGAVLIQLAIRLRGIPGWTIYKNFHEAGCDIVIQQSDPGRSRSRPLKVEVKTRQGLLTQRRHLNTMQFSVTENERNACDFVVAFWFERNAYFIVPRNALTRTSAGRKVLYKFVAYWSAKQGRFTDASAEFLDRWDRILDHLRAR
jgi:hypothetical protein